MKKKDRRGLWWKNIDAHERSLRGAYAVAKRWEKKTFEQKQAYSRMMNKAKKHGK